MADIAALGFQINSQELVKGERSLDRLTGASKRAEMAAKGLGTNGTRAARMLAAANDNTARSTTAMGRAMQFAKTQVIAFGLAAAAAFSFGSVLRAADAYTQFRNKLRVAGVEAANMADVEERLFAAANRNGVEISALSQLYSRASIASGELGTTQAELLQFVDGVTAALRLQGGSAASSSGALLQLSQSLGAGIVRAEEFNSILEGAFPIAQAAARGMDGMGGSVARLRSAIIEGKVTSQEFFRALLKGFTATEAAAAGLNLTVGQAMTVLGNSFTRFTGALDQRFNATGTLASGIAAIGRGLDSLALNMDAVGRVAEGIGVAMLLAFGPAILGAVTSLIGAVEALTIALAKNPIGLIGVAIASAIGLMVTFRDETFKLGDTTFRVGSFLDALWTTVKEGIRGVLGWIFKLSEALVKFVSFDFSGAMESAKSAASHVKASALTIIDAWRSAFSGVPVGGGFDESGFAGFLTTPAAAIPKLPSVPDKDAQKAAKKYAKLIQGANQFIAAQRLEQQALGMTEQAANALRHEQEMLNKAANDNIKLSPTQRKELAALAQQMAAVEAETSRAKEAFNFAKDTARGFVSDLKQGLQNGEGLWKSFANAAVNALNKITDKLLNQVIDALFQVNSAALGIGSGGGFGGGILGAVGSLFGGLFAKGGAFQRGHEVTAFARGGVVNSPTVFPMARGAGLMGEAGPEAVMPLRRAPNGKLGVQATGAGSQQIQLEIVSRVDKDGNIKTFVESVSGAVVNQAAPHIINSSLQQVPSIAVGAMHENGTRGTNPR